MRAILIALIALSLAALVLLPPAQDEQAAASQEACEMLQLWHESGGEFGWPPDYAEVLCSEAQKQF